MKLFNHFIHGSLLLTLFLCVKPMDNSINNNEIKIKNRFEVPLPHKKLYFLPNNRLLGIGIGSYNVFLWTLKKDKIDKKHLFIKDDSFSRINALSLNRNKKLIALAVCYEDKIGLFSTQTWQPIKSFRSVSATTKMAFSPTNKNLLATTGYLKKITLGKSKYGILNQKIYNIAYI